MESTRTTWRSHPFRPGQVLLARVSFIGWPNNEFVAGHRYVFESATYSHYDSSTVFTFREHGTDRLLCWWWHDDEADSLCGQRFEGIGNELVR